MPLVQPGFVPTGGDLGLSAFNAMDEHGYSLSEYATELKASLGIQDGRSAAGSTDASDLQLQHQEMANLVKRERLSASLSKRPSLDLLQQRNILPDATQATLARQKLASAMERRPTLDLLQQRNILPSSAGGENPQEQLREKKRRLEGFLEKRPTIEEVQAALPNAASLYEHGATSLDQQFDDGGM